MRDIEIIIGGRDDDHRLRQLLSGIFDHFHAVYTGDVDIHQHQINITVSYHLHGLISALCLSHDLHIRKILLQKDLHRSSFQLFILHN